MNASSQSTPNSAEPWYRFGMVWMIIALPLAVVVASLVTVSIAFDSAPIVIEKTDYEPVSSKAAK